MSDDVADLPTRASKVQSQNLESGYELQIQVQDRQWVVALSSSKLKVGSSKGTRVNDLVLDYPDVSNRQATLRLVRGRVFLVGEDPLVPCLLNGKQVVNTEFNPGDELVFAGCRIRLYKCEEYIATLVGYSEPHLQQRWDLADRPHTVGRAGGAVDVGLEDPQVANLHAVLECSGAVFKVRPEAEVRLNGAIVESAAVIEDGDILQFGNQYLRYRQVEQTAEDRAPTTQDATIMFCDIWDYSSLFKERALDYVVLQMNEFYRELGRAIQNRGGVVMRYVGDAILASFAGNDHRRQAVRAALDLHQCVAHLNRQWAEKGFPPFRIGVGINSGDIMLGDLGYSGKLEFSALGADVNLAARIEKLTRESQAGVLIGPSTAEGVRESFTLRSLGLKELKGYWKPLEIFEVKEPR